LGRGQAWGEGRFSTLAGFVEPGESLEGAVAREVREEVGVGVTDVRYVASQPWPFPSSLMVGFVARVDGDPTLQVDGIEVTEAGWFTRQEVARAAARTDTAAEDEPGMVLQRISPKLSISRYLIDCWLSGEI
jgi:NAD+ diphosphatase